MINLSFRSAFFTWLAIGLAGAIFAGSAFAAEKRKGREKNKPEGDSAPVLMSRIGGGSTWADVHELRAAAEQGNPKAEAHYAEMLLCGDEANGVAQDRPRALALLEKAARAGEASAAFRLGMLFDDGDGVAKDHARALAYFRAAASGGAVEALHNIGAAYASGRGVKRDYAEGLAWLIVAKKRGAQSRAEEAVRAQIQKAGRPELITKAEQRALAIERELGQGKMTELLPPPAESGTTKSQ
jgi:uncharacterized protein